MKLLVFSLVSFFLLASTLSKSNSEGKQHSFYRQLRFTGEHEYVTVIHDAPEGLYGAAATINVWQPTVERGVIGREFSATQIRIQAGTDDDFDVIEAGWHVYPWYYNQQGEHGEPNKARFFISWTNNSYASPCYNLDCGGFEMESNEVELGSAFEPTSLYEGEQIDIVVTIWKDTQLRRWWLMYDDIMVGYWPEELFTHLRTRGTNVEWGGEVFNTKHNDRFTSTEMGSGHFAAEGYGKASYFKQLLVKTSGTRDHWMIPQSLRAEVTDHNYYTIHTEADIDGLGNGGFYYGGPGNSNP